MRFQGEIFSGVLFTELQTPKVYSCAEPFDVFSI